MPETSGHILSEESYLHYKKLKTGDKPPITVGNPKCHYCNTQLRIDKAGNCKNCGTGDVPIAKVEIPMATFYTTQLMADLNIMQIPLVGKHRAMRSVSVD